MNRTFFLGIDALLQERWCAGADDKIALLPILKFSRSGVHCKT
jgi:hypothetical protein